jgi:hypothetical protein
MHSKSATATTVLPASLTGYIDRRNELSLCIKEGKGVDPELVQQWLHQGLQSMATLGATKEELLPVFRGLQVFALSESPSSGYQELHRTLAQLDAQLGPDKGGFSKLLDNALEAGNIEVPDQFEMDQLPSDIKSHYQGIIEINSRLRALDHLSHALSLPIDLPACALILNGLLCDLEGLNEEQHQSATEELSHWVSLRNLPHSIKLLLLEQQQVTDLNHLSLENLNEQSLIQPILLWILAHHHTKLPKNNAAAVTLDHALQNEGLPPIEVLYRADW